jgi:lysyl-tRNA synthetase class 2
LRDRREKLDRLIAEGVDPYVAHFHRSHTTRQALAELAGAGSAGPVTVAGRLMARRGSGGMAFAVLEDGEGRIQLVAQRDKLGEQPYDRFQHLDLGDIISATGRVAPTRRGEPSVWLDAFQLLTKSLRPPPEKWHGLKDIETRYRQRYIDLIANPEVRDTFVKRSRIISALRRYFDEHGFLEVETPVLQEIPGGGHARPFVTRHNALDRDFYLRIALELHLKRLLVGGIERVYEIGRLFRNEGVDPWHNPEFTMLECYQAYADLEDMMRVAEEFIPAVCEAAGRRPRAEWQGEEIDLTPPFRRERMQDLVLEATGRELHGRELVDVYEEAVEPELRQPVFVTDFPIEVSPLARKREDDPRFVERFELIIAGKEFANAFTELTDPLDQRARFEQQKAALAAGDLEAHPFDEDFVRALEYGMPPAGGMGVGIDRLVMLLTDSASIRDVIFFPQLKEAPDARA